MKTNNILLKLAAIAQQFKYISIFILFISYSLFAQQNKIVKDIRKTAFENQIDSLRAIYANNKTLPNQYELQCLIALSFYPELANTTINFKQKHIQTTMASRPPFRVLFQADKNRSYNICINNSKKLNGALLTNISFNEQIGVIGHELAHVVDYTHKNKWQLLTTALRYIFVPKYKRNLEAQTDITTINHGLGWQIYDFVDYLMNKSTVSRKYKKHKEKFYLSSKQILEIILKSTLYSEPAFNTVIIKP